MTNIFLGPELADVNFPNLCWILLEPKVNPSPIQMKIEFVLVSQLRIYELLEILNLCPKENDTDSFVNSNCML